MFETFEQIGTRESIVRTKLAALTRLPVHASCCHSRGQSRFAAHVCGTPVLASKESKLSIMWALGAAEQPQDGGAHAAPGRAGDRAARTRPCHKIQDTRS